jgi:hypothetical protein
VSDRDLPAGGTPAGGHGDDDTEMAATRFLPDDVIEAIVHDQPVDPVHGPLVAFARSVRSLGDGPAPRPSSELAALLEHGLDAGIVSPNGDDAATAEVAADPPRSAAATAAALAGKAAGFGIVAKVALGTALAAAGVGAAGAAGVLPSAASEAVRHAIESVSPIEFDDHDDAPGSDDPAPASSGSSESPGTSGGATESDEPTIADDTTGAEHRPDPGAVDEPPGQSGETGLTRADETPAAPHAPDETPAATTPAATAPSTIPPQGPPAGTGQGGAPESVPSTVPTASGDHADGHASGT